MEITKMDTLKIYEKLKKSFSEEQARDLVDVLNITAESQFAQVATKTDIQSLEAKIGNLDTRIVGLEKELDRVGKWVTLLVGLMGMLLTLNITFLVKVLPLLK
ncbi:MAG TPA: hypothetical protein ENG51_01135 [Deltaproteobacteria bacterium]|nr:hypothetical protein [Deltaproteobacteria bacterium]